MYYQGYWNGSHGQVDTTTAGTTTAEGGAMTMIATSQIRRTG